MDPHEFHIGLCHNPQASSELQRPSIAFKIVFLQQCANNDNENDDNNDDDVTTK
jgi:hypothetical protein